MVNYFSYNYATQREEHPFGLTTEVSAAPWHDGHLLLRIGLASQPVETADLPPNNLVFVGPYGRDCGLRPGYRSGPRP